MPIINLPPSTPAPTGMQQMMDKMKELQAQASEVGGMSSEPATAAQLKADIAEDNAAIKEAKAHYKEHQAEGNMAGMILDKVAIAQHKAERSQARLQLKALKAQLPAE